MPRQIDAFTCEFCDRKYYDRDECVQHEKDCQKVADINNRFRELFQEGGLVLVPSSLVADYCDVNDIGCIYHSESNTNYSSMVLCQILEVKAFLGVEGREVDEEDEEATLYVSGGFTLNLKVLSINDLDCSFSVEVEDFCDEYNDLVNDHIIKALRATDAFFEDEGGYKILPSTHSEFRRIVGIGLKASIETLKERVRFFEELLSRL